MFLECPTDARESLGVQTKNVIKIAVSPAAKSVISGIARKHDMKEIGVASRIYEWFGQQDDVVQKAILRLLPEGYERKLLRSVLEDLAEEPKFEKLVGSDGTVPKKRKGTDGQ